jgi:hypothetical protein
VDGDHLLSQAQVQNVSADMQHLVRITGSLMSAAALSIVQRAMVCCLIAEVRCLGARLASGLNFAVLKPWQALTDPTQLLLKRDT